MTPSGLPSCLKTPKTSNITNFSPKRITVKRKFMKVSSNEIWEQAEVLAKSINEAYQNSKKSDIHVVGEKLDHAIEDISVNNSKTRFLGICNVVANYMPEKSDRFVKAVAVANSLPLEQFTEDKDVTFEMFIVCVRFHLAFYKRDWKEDK